MSIMFWVWLGVIVGAAILELLTMELVSIWFTVGAVVPFVLAAVMGNFLWEVQVAIFVVISALLIIFLRKITKKWLLKNANEKTNIDAMVGRKLRMLERTDFETLGSVKVNDVVWTAVGEGQQAIEKDVIVEVVRVDGNKLIVKPEGQKTDKAETQKSISQKKKKDRSIEVEKEGGEK